MTKEIAELLLSHGADVNSSDSSGWVPLHGAACVGNLEMLEVLLTHKANVNAKNISGLTPLHQAVVGKHTDVKIVELLLAHKAEVNIRDDKETPLLHLAVCFCNKDVVELLLRHGANVHAKAPTGKTPLAVATTDPDDEDLSAIAELLRKYGAKE